MEGGGVVMAVAGQFSSIKLKPWTVFKYLQKYRLDIDGEGNCVMRFYSDYVS